MADNPPRLLQGYGALANNDCPKWRTGSFGGIGHQLRRGRGELPSKWDNQSEWLSQKSLERLPCRGAPHEHGVPVWVWVSCWILALDRMFTEETCPVQCLRWQALELNPQVLLRWWKPIGKLPVMDIAGSITSTCRRKKSVNTFAAVEIHTRWLALPIGSTRNPANRRLVVEGGFVYDATVTLLNCRTGWSGWETAFGRPVYLDANDMRFALRAGVQLWNPVLYYLETPLILCQENQGRVLSVGPHCRLVAHLKALALAKF